MGKRPWLDPHYLKIKIKNAAVAASGSPGGGGGWMVAISGHCPSGPFADTEGSRDTGVRGLGEALGVTGAFRRAFSSMGFWKEAVAMVTWKARVKNPNPTCYIMLASESGAKWMPFMIREHGLSHPLNHHQPARGLQFCKANEISALNLIVGDITGLGDLCLEDSVPH